MSRTSSSIPRKNKNQPEGTPPSNGSLKTIESRGWFGPDKLSELLKENNERIAIFVASAKTASAKSSNQPSRSKI